PATRLSSGRYGAAYAECGGALWSGAVNVRGWGGTVSTHCWIGGFRNPVFCIHIPTSASTPFILGKSRMRRRARTDLCGGWPVMVVPTATVEACGSWAKDALSFP